MGFDLTSILGSNLGTAVKDIVGAFKLDPTKKAEFQAVIDANAHEIAVKQAEYEVKLLDVQTKEIEVASSNIRAEATNGDKFTSRGRPSFIYVMLLIFACNYILFPIINRPPLNFPEALFWLFGSCMLGYTGARSWERIGISKINAEGKK